jgi:hypothetical protein
MERPVADIDWTPAYGFPASDGPDITPRDIRAEEEVLEKILGSIDERRARFEAEVEAEMSEAIERLGIDWGRAQYADELDENARAALISQAFRSPAARAVVTGYVKHLQEHRAEYLWKLIDLNASGE